MSQDSLQFNQLRLKSDILQNEGPSQAELLQHIIERVAEEHHNSDAQSGRTILPGDAKEEDPATFRSSILVQGLCDLQVLGTFALVIVQNGIRIGVLTDVGKGIPNSIVFQLIDGQSRNATAGTIEDRRHS